MRKCLECGTELADSNAIIFHTCEAYPTRKAESWTDTFINSNNERRGKE